MPQKMTDLITDMCEKIFDCVTIHLAVFKSLLSRKYGSTKEGLIKGKKHCLCTGNSSKNYRRI